MEEMRALEVYWSWISTGNRSFGRLWMQLECNTTLCAKSRNRSGTPHKTGSLRRFSLDDFYDRNHAPFESNSTLLRLCSRKLSGLPHYSTHIHVVLSSFLHFSAWKGNNRTPLRGYHFIWWVQCWLRLVFVQTHCVVLSMSILDGNSHHVCSIATWSG